MTIYRVEHVYEFPANAVAADAWNLGLLDPTAVTLDTVKFAAYQSLFDNGVPYRLVFQAWRDQTSPSAALGSAAITTAHTTALTQLGKTAPAWQRWSVDTQFTDSPLV